MPDQLNLFPPTETALERKLRKHRDRMSKRRAEDTAAGLRQVNIAKVPADCVDAVRAAAKAAIDGQWPPPERPGLPRWGIAAVAVAVCGSVIGYFIGLGA